MDRRTKTVRNSTMKASSRAWLARHLNDPYVRKAQQDHYRSRAAYKLLHLHEKMHLFTPNMRVLDLGCAPGGWSQVLARYGKGAKIVGVDCLMMPPIKGVDFIKGDVEDDATMAQVMALSPQYDLILSDVAPSTIGHAQTDHLRMMNLLETMWDVGQHLLVPGGAIAMKVFQGKDLPSFIQQMRPLFQTFQLVKPLASRSLSVEHYIVGKGFKA